MHKLTNTLAVVSIIALAGVSSAPAMAAPITGGRVLNGIDCSLPANANNPQCLLPSGQGGPNGKNYRTGPNSGPTNSGPTNNNGPTSGAPGGTNGPTTNSAGNMPPPGGPAPGSWNWSPQYRDQFHQRFRGYDFGTFGTPNFSLSIGIGIPGSYYHYLRPVPRSIYRYYPWFRGYLYFVGQDGRFVIVSPRSHRIVAVI